MCTYGVKVTKAAMFKHVWKFEGCLLSILLEFWKLCYGYRLWYWIDDRGPAVTRMRRLSHHMTHDGLQSGLFYHCRVITLFVLWMWCAKIFLSHNICLACSDSVKAQSSWCFPFPLLLTRVSHFWILVFFTHALCRQHACRTDKPAWKIDLVNRYLENLFKAFFSDFKLYDVFNHF